MHGVVQMNVPASVASQVPRQQVPWPGTQAAPVPRQVSAPKTQRGLGLALTSQTPQQVVEPPELHVSPLGRQFEVLTPHLPPLQRFEQHSEAAVQLWPETVQSAPPHTPKASSTSKMATATRRSSMWLACSSII